MYQFYNFSRTKRIRLFTCLIIFAIAPGLEAQEHTPDANTLLLLHFNDNLTGADAETPILSSGISYSTGIFGNAANFASGNQLYYSYADNLNSTEGTLEFWIKPNWNGSDGINHFALIYGAGGGMLFGKDGGNYWRSIFNRYGDVGGNPEVGVGTNVSSSWLQNEWHHAAFTWTSQSIKLYIDGDLIDQNTVGFTLPVLSETQFQIGGEQTSNYLDAVVDELRISDIERTAEEIANSFIAGVTVSTLTIAPKPIDMLETWWKTPTLTASTNFGTLTIPPASATWVSSDNNVATVNSLGRITANAAGTATITATVNGISDNVTVNVTAPVLQPDNETIDSFLATPASQYVHEMPVVILRYMPTTDGVNVDPVLSGWTSTLSELKTRLTGFEKKVKFTLETGSRFRNYNDPSARPSLGYRVIAIINVYEEIPKGFDVPGDPGFYYPDYDQMLTRFDSENYVNNLGVKEFWIWGYHHGEIVPVESNMSSPVTGDISNSYRFNNDLPIHNHTYTVYNYNFTRSQAEAVHDHGHQLEAILGHANILQDGNSDLFWKQFVGQDINDNFITGRCGWTHMPPNTTTDYDYENTTIVSSDVEDWTPDGSGATTLVNVDTWGNLVFNWPDGETDFSQRIETQFYIYWMQSMPGFNNVIEHGTDYMQNWWAFTAEWDSAIQNNMGLYGPDKAENDISLSVSLTAFTARAGDGRVTLKWTTESEIDNQGYIILRSKNENGLFEQLDSYQVNDELKGAGTSSNRHDYTYTDRYVYNGTTYWYKLIDVDVNGTHTEHGPLSATPTIYEIEQINGNTPRKFALYQNHPNPFNPSTEIAFDVPEETHLTLAVYNMIGQQVAILYDGWISGGMYRKVWNASQLPSGTYFYHVTSEDFRQSKRMLLIK